MNTESISILMAQWAVVGILTCVILPRIEWKTRLRRSLFILLCGPFVWFVAMVVYIEDRFLSVDKNTK